MVRGNKELPNAHFHKWWQRHVKTWFDQPARKKRRHDARQEKIRRLGDRPLGRLRPVVHMPSQLNNWKVREGRGFTEAELKAAGVNHRFARTVGIAVDLRRKNRSQEGLDENVERLKAYLDRLVIFPRRSGKPKKNAGGLPDDTVRTSELKTSKGKRMRDLFPVKKTRPGPVVFEKIPESNC